jgi:homoserine dehydrogenase
VAKTRKEKAMTYKLCLIGCGNVGHGFIKLLRAREAWLKGHGFAVKIVAICDLVRGSVLAPDGFPLAQLDAALDAGQRLDTAFPPKRSRGLGALEVIRESGANIVLELTPTDLHTGQPATSHIEEALRSGKHVVTTNKGPVALFYRRLKRLADENRVKFRFEGTVMSGTPVFSLVESGLAGATIRGVRGILNGTTNYILTRMEEGWEYEEALQEAQALGYAETDPTADVEGHDALAKITILGNVLLSGDLTPWEVPVQGITGLTRDEVQAAARMSHRYKLIAQARVDEGGRVVANVAPKRLALSDPLAAVSGVTNALTFELEPLGEIIIVGPGAGRRETGHAVLTDLLAIHRSMRDK